MVVITTSKKCLLLSMLMLCISMDCWSQDKSSASDASHSASSAIKPYLGLWQTIDDDTNLPRSLVSISIEQKELVAKIIKVYLTEDETENPVCEECKGELKNVPIIGLNILKNMKFNKDRWQDGEILDPKNGKFYDAKIWLEESELKVRGYIGFFFRTQKWIRYQPEQQ